MDNNELGALPSDRATAAEPVVSALRDGIPSAARLAEWLHSHDTGISSEAIFHYMIMGVTGGGTPSDAGDLGRCVRLLDRFPEWAERMPEMARVSDDWAALVSIWEELVAAYRDDLMQPDRDHSWRSYEMLSALWWDKTETGVWTRRAHGFTSQGTEAGTDETVGLGPQGDGPVLAEDAPTTPSTVNQGEAEILREALAVECNCLRDLANKKPVDDYEDGFAQGLRTAVRCFEQAATAREGKG